MKTETLTYREYELEIIEHPAPGQYQVQIRPACWGLPLLPAMLQCVMSTDREAAIREAMAD